MILFLLIALSLFWIFSSFSLILFCHYIKYGTHSLDCCFFFIIFLVCFSFNFVPRYFISFLFFQIQSSFLELLFFILFLICFFFQFCPSVFYFIFLSNLSCHSFKKILSFFLFYYIFLLSSSSFSFIIFYQKNK